MSSNFARKLCRETYSGPVKESVCPGIQLMLSLSRLLERQQEELPHIYRYKSSWKYFRILILILSISKNQQQEHSQIWDCDPVQRWTGTQLSFSLINRERSSFEASIYETQGCKARGEGSLEMNLKRWVLLDHSQFTSQGGIIARRCFCIIWGNSNLEGEVSSVLNHHNLHLVFVSREASIYETDMDATWRVRYPVPSIIYLHDPVF